MFRSRNVRLLGPLFLLRLAYRHYAPSDNNGQHTLAGFTRLSGVRAARHLSCTVPGIARLGIAATSILAVNRMRRNIK
ncbi:MAG: hypothetical protein ACRD3S_05600 [Terracidiphilus sp.]